MNHLWIFPLFLKASFVSAGSGKRSERGLTKEFMTEKVSESGNTVTEEKTESGEKFLKGHPGFGPSLSRPPRPFLFLVGMTLSSAASLHWGEQDKCS